MRAVLAAAWAELMAVAIFPRPSWWVLAWACCAAVVIDWIWRPKNRTEAAR